MTKAMSAVLLSALLLVVSLGWGGKEHPKAEKSKAEQSASDYPKAEHQKAGDPDGEHPTAEHPRPEKTE